MNGVRFLVLALAVGWVLAFPAAALGQPLQDHLSRVTVTIDGANAPDDTVVTAFIGAKEVATAMTTDGVAIIKIPGTNATTGREISFRVGDVVADEVDTWETGGHLDKSFQISLTTYVPPAPAIPDHQSRLVVTINGEMAPDGTVVTAIMDGADVAMATTKNGIAFLKVPGTSANIGKEISFRVGDVMADETDTWEQGGHRDKKFEISLTTYVPPLPVPPHISRLLVSIDGLPAPDGTVVTAWMDGSADATALTTNGVAIIRIEGDGSDGGRAISFTIGVLTGGIIEDLAADEVDFWEKGGHIDKNFAISVYTAPRTPAEAFAPLIDHLVDGRANLLGVFWFNDETQTYLSYDPDPDFAFFNNLETVESRQVFWVRLRAPQHFLGKTRPAGWSLVALP